MKFIALSELYYDFGHALKISNSIYKKRISSFSAIPGIAKKLKNELEADSSIGFFAPAASELSADMTVKYLFSY